MLKYKIPQIVTLTLLLLPLSYGELYKTKIAIISFPMIAITSLYSKRDLNPHSRNGKGILSPSCLPIPPFEHPRRERAENETRTRDPNLGKVMLYQLSYFRVLF